MCCLRNPCDSGSNPTIACCQSDRQARRGLGLVAQAQQDHPSALESFRENLQILRELDSHKAAAVIADTRHRATKMADHLKEKLTAEEIDSAQRFAREHSVDAVVQQVLAGSYQP